MQTTIPTHPHFCACDMCEDLETDPIGPGLRAARSSKRAAHLNICPVVSPLARAALDNGVTFDDVRAYCEHVYYRSADADIALYAADTYERWLYNLDSPDPLARDMALDLVTGAALDGALARSFLAQTDGSIAAARIWWHGVLP